MRIPITIRISHLIGQMVPFTALVCEPFILIPRCLTLNLVSTANLIKHMLGVAPEWVHGLPMDVPTVIPETGGVTVTLIDANHCQHAFSFV